MHRHSLPLTLSALLGLGALTNTADVLANDWSDFNVSEVAATRVIRDIDNTPTTVGYCTYRYAGRRVLIEAQVNGADMPNTGTHLGNNIITAWLLMPNEDPVQFDYTLSSAGEDGTFRGAVILPAQSREYIGDESFVIDFRQHNASIFSLTSDEALGTELFTSAGIDGSAMIGTCTIPF